MAPHPIDHTLIGTVDTNIATSAHHIHSYVKRSMCSLFVWYYYVLKGPFKRTKRPRAKLVSHRVPSNQLDPVTFMYTIASNQPTYTAANHTGLDLSLHR